MVRLEEKENVDKEEKVPLLPEQFRRWQLSGSSHCCARLADFEEEARLRLEEAERRLHAAAALGEQRKRKGEEALAAEIERNVREEVAAGKLLAEQRQVGSEWQRELETLAFRLKARLDSVNHSNSQLEREAEELEAAGMAAEAEDQRMRELCGEYSGQATRLRRKLKKEMDKDEESYMEMFI